MDFALCTDCHKDGHHGQFKTPTGEARSCDQCHTTSGFARSTFDTADHATSRFPLLGAHWATACDACHVADVSFKEPGGKHLRGTSTTRFVWPAVPGCETCHASPHENAFKTLAKKPACNSCHSETSFKYIRFDHDTTHFKLMGKHAIAPCDSCHRPVEKEGEVYAGLAFKTCADCHDEAHPGQLPPKQGRKCQTCHTTASFGESTFSVPQHGRTPFPLTGAHVRAACVACHPSTPPSVPVRTRVGTQPHVDIKAGVTLHMQGNMQRCNTCHGDPHNGQFAARVAKAGCADCHVTESFVTVAFDHDKETTFPLRGGHANVACSACHREQTLASGKRAVNYRQATACEACHEDAHLGQFAMNHGGEPCVTCHAVQSFRTVHFEHNDPNRTSFALTGRHTIVPCEACHFKVDVGGARPVQRFVQLPQGCEGCHADYHQGALPQGCATCHTTEHWDGATYADHERFFALRGAHRAIPCVSCHSKSLDASVPGGCNDCHRDMHGGEFGNYCGSCHNEETWVTDFSFDAHRRLNFPLRGMHAAVPCEQCHPGAFEKNYRDTPATCYGCHQKEYVQTAVTSVNHLASNFSTSCRNCHEPWRFSRALYPAHEACFPIAKGPHTGLTCESCHTRLAGLTGTGACMSGTSTCVSCHVHNQQVSASQHTNVPGYAFGGKQCLACHPLGY